MMRRRVWALARALGWLLAIGCGKEASKPRADAAPAPPPSVPSVAPQAPEAPLSATPPASPSPICRVLRLTGAASLGDATLTSGAELDGSEWVTLEKGGALTLKHSASGRELSISGPALFRACRRGREQLLLARGKVIGGGGVGVRPGAEVSIATPIAAVRYADAELTVELDDKQLSVAVRAGQVEVDSGSSQPVSSPLHAKDKLKLPLGKPDPAALLARCEAAARDAEATARRIADRDAPESLGERAQANVRARKAARAACTVAAAATGLVADPSQRAGFWAEAARWEGLWEAVPRRKRADSPEK